MFTAMQQTNGTLRFETHVSPSDLTPEEARDALDALEGLLTDLRRQAAMDRPVVPPTEITDVPERGPSLPPASAA